MREFLTGQGWEERVRDASRFRLMMERADRTVVARESGLVIGFGRALCDGASNGYISMLAVKEEFRGRGIGTRLVRELMGDDVEITWVLRPGRNSSGFWQKLGFNPSEIAMERTRTDSRTGDQAMIDRSDR